MKKSIFKGLALVSGLMLTSVSFAQDTPEVVEESKPVISGSLDMYTKYDFSGRQNSATSFTKTQNSYELNMASIKAEHSIGKVSGVIDLGFGRRAEEFAYTQNNTNLAIKQAYVTLQATDKLLFTAGTFGTHIGYELLDAYMNKNYSMSYAFSFGPFFNTGAKANYQIDDKFSAMLGLMLPTDSRSAGGAKSVVGQFGYSVDKTSAYFNFSYDPYGVIDRTQFDVVVNHELNDEFSLGFNGTLQLLDTKKTTLNAAANENWYSAVAYVTYNVKENMSLNYRGEYFSGSKGNTIAFAMPGTNVIGNTISLNYKINNLTIIPELRYDMATESVFADRDNKATKGYGFALLGATYSF